MDNSERGIYEGITMVLASWLILLLGMFLCGWYFWIRGRGALWYWIRGFKQEEKWILGKVLPLDAPASTRQQLLTDVNAEVRTLDQRVTTVVREWDNDTKTFFMGVVLRRPLEKEEIPAGFELRHWAPAKVVRLSGNNRLDERLEGHALEEYLKKKGLSVNRRRPMRLSGQSISFYQWEVSEAGESSSPLSRFEEWTFQLRDNLVLPVLGTVLAVGLLGTRQPLLFAAGVLLITFLSGACKFIFIHQRADEADEVHLQNY